MLLRGVVQVTVAARLTERSPRGLVFMSFAFPGVHSDERCDVRRLRLHHGDSGVQGMCGEDIEVRRVRTRSSGRRSVGYGWQERSSSRRS